MIEKTQLNDLTDEQLIEVEGFIKSIREERKRESFSNLTDALLKSGVSKEDLINFLKGKPESKPKFRNPDDKSQTWTGKGRKPKWFTAQAAKGITEADMKI